MDFKVSVTDFHAWRRSAFAAELAGISEGKFFFATLKQITYNLRDPENKNLNYFKILVYITRRVNENVTGKDKTIDSMQVRVLNTVLDCTLAEFDARLTKSKEAAEP